MRGDIMRWDFLMTTMLFAMGTFLLVEAIFIFSRQEKMVGLRIIGFMALFNSLFMFGYGGFLLSDTIAVKILFNHFQYLLIPYFGALWYLMSIQQKNNNRKFRPGFMLLVMAIPILSTVTNVLYPMVSELTGSEIWIQKLFFTSHVIQTPSFEFGLGFVGLVFTKGPVYYLQMGYNSLLNILTIINYVIIIQKSERKIQKRALLLIGTSLIAGTVIIMSFLKPTTAVVDVAPFFTGFLSFMTFLLLFKYELFDLMPLAYREIFQNSETPIFIFNKSHAVISSNRVADTLFHERISHFDHLDLKAFETFDPGIYADLTEKGEHEWIDFEKEETRFFLVRMISLFNNRNIVTGYTVYYQDITAHKKELKQMAAYAEYDDLTRIHNRRYFFRKAVEDFDLAIEYKQKISLIMFDLDDFKEINDIFGHQAGDAVLAEMGALFSKEIGEAGLFARYGGEEFIIFLKNKTIPETEQLARRLCDLLSGHVFVHEKRPIKTSASFGVTGVKKQINQAFDRYIKEADIALYKAKTQGKKQVIVFGETNNIPVSTVVF
jgi:diguanylate cyclase (GGDEF)-like protein